MPSALNNDHEKRGTGQKTEEEFQITRKLMNSKFRKCLEIMDQRRNPFSNSLTIAAASQAGCGILHTKDMQYVQKIMNLTVKNPFIDLPSED